MQEILLLEEDILSIINNGGPEPNQYEKLNNWFQKIGNMIKNNIISRKQVQEIRNVFGDSFSSPDTMQGFVNLKPHGYAGDFEIIDKIYTKWLSPRKELVKWDKFFHWQKAPIAVRNRKQYFKELLSEINHTVNCPLILNVASGPCRDIFEYYQKNPSSKIQIECIDIDNNAIKYAQSLLDQVKDIKVIFHHKNIFRFKSIKKYHLIWVGGLFDYFNDRQFIFLLRSLFNMVVPGGELIIGNFSKSNPTRDYMEFGEWFLHHRTEDKLFMLAEQSGCSSDSISIEKEEAGVNLFLRVKKS